MADDRFLTVMAPELDIVLWVPRGRTASEVSAWSRKMFDDAAAQDLHLALIDLPESLLAPHWPGVAFDRPAATCLRSCLMKPEHLDWLDRIWDVLDGIAR